jgi:hypothetical protein
METSKKPSREILDAVEGQERGEGARAQEELEKAMRRRTDVLAKALSEKPPVPEVRGVPISTRAPVRRQSAVWLAAIALSATVTLLLAMNVTAIVAWLEGGRQDTRVATPRQGPAQTPAPPDPAERGAGPRP